MDMLLLLASTALFFLRLSAGRVKSSTVDDRGADDDDGAMFIAEEVSAVCANELVKAT